MDLLTVLMHEMGHALSLDHDDRGVMREALAAGTREAPPSEAAPSSQAIPLIDRAFASWAGPATTA